MNKVFLHFNLYAMTINNSIKQNLQTETDVEIETSKKKMAIAAGMYVCLYDWITDVQNILCNGIKWLLWRNHMEISIFRSFLIQTPLTLF